MSRACCTLRAWKRRSLSPHFSLSNPLLFSIQAVELRGLGRSRARAARQRRSRMAAPTRSRLAVAGWRWLLTRARQRQGGARSAAARRPQLLARAPSCGSGETTALARPHSSAVRPVLQRLLLACLRASAATTPTLALLLFF
jgi:predicted RNA-binding Zn ribbon-like protein